MVILEISKSDRARCRTCNKNIEKDVLKYGVAKSNDGYMNVEWYHEFCFWDKRAGQYYKRKNKKVNILLKYDQFSGNELFTAEQCQQLRENIHKSNLRWGTREALEKAGIEVPEPAPKAKPVKRVAEPIEVDDEPETEPPAPVVPEELPAKRRRVAVTKYA